MHITTTLIVNRIMTTTTALLFITSTFSPTRCNAFIRTATTTTSSNNNIHRLNNSFRRFLSSSSSSSKSTTITTTTNNSNNNNNNKLGILRRARAPFDGDQTTEYINRMKREKGLYQDFAYGSFRVPPLSSTASSSSTSTTETAETVTTTTSLGPNYDESQYHMSFPEVFPLEGKKDDEIPIRMRFAPSPTGSLHVGGARTALYNYLVAKKAQVDAQQYKQQNQYHPGGAFVLRIEDTDVARSTKESEESVLADLRWLGLHWDEGPDISMDRAKYGPYRQSERNAIYQAAAMKLIQENKAYRCFCTPEELDEMKQQQEAMGQTFQYDGRWRDADPALVNKMLAAETPYTVRFKVPSNTRIVIDDIVRGTVGWDADMTVGDFILLRSSGIPVYNFCVAVDDATMGIATVVRAEEHLTNTVRQVLILDALNAPRPRYAHCSLILGEDKQKLSKRHGATSCNQYRIDGYLPDAMINYLALLGWNDGTDNEIFTRDELIDAFQLERVVKSPSVFDIEKLKWINGQHLKLMSVEQIIPYVIDQMVHHVPIVQDGIVETTENQRLYDFALASTSLAKQMMLTTRDAVTNAITVLGYNLPSSFNEMMTENQQHQYKEAKEMIELGTFYPIAMKILEQYDNGILPMPVLDSPLAAFQDSTGQAIEEDDKKGDTCTYTHEYLIHMKQLAKELNVKGKLFFHPLRLMLTGEMSGQDVTKQLSLLALATRTDSIVDSSKAGVVPFDIRMQRLREFCQTIPMEFQQPRTSTSSSNVAATDGTTTTEATIVHANGEQGTINGASSSTGSSSSSSMMMIDDPKSTYDGPPITALDIRVGKIVRVWEHEEADILYCEEIDIGENQPRMIASGLRPYLSQEQLLNRLVLVLCNLKERKLVGFPSHGMVLCASNHDHTIVRLVNPPIDAKIGERVYVPDFPIPDDEPYYAENKISKKKIVEQLKPYFKTNQYGIPTFLGRPFMTSAGACTSPIPDGTVS